VAVTLVFSFAATWAILKVVDVLVGFRATETAEDVGIDLAEHGEVAYTWRERSRAQGRAPDGMTDAELTALREQLVLEATERVLEAVRIDPSPARSDDRG
jgi:hypothetical protein